MSNFETVGEIVLQALDNIPKSFYFPPQESVTETGSIPYNTNISAVEVIVYDEDETVVTSDIIDGTPSIANNIITVTFKYPVINGNGRYKVTFFCTLDSGSTLQFDFQRLVVK